jgi:antitoxin (DNA-binding transcriptional repressor) of toxin-antitoxin stability system
MKTGTVQELQSDFEQLESWLDKGEEIDIHRDGEPIARLSRIKQTPEGKTFVVPDFRVRLDELWGDRVTAA